MLLLSFSRRIASAKAALDSASQLFDLLDKLSKINMNVEQRVYEIADGSGSKIGANGNALHSDLAAVSAISKEFSARALFRTIENLIEVLTSELVHGIAKPGYVNELISGLDAFAETYNTFVAQQTGKSAVPLLSSANKLQTSLDDLRSHIDFLQDNFVEPCEISESEAEFSLMLETVTDLRDFAGKLNALHDLYEELCSLVGITTASHPLRICKVESGSLWTRLVGDVKVVQLMIDFLRASTRFVHRNFTREGKIEGIPRTIESMDRILDFSNRLKANGVEVSRIEQTLAKSTFAIATSLNELVVGQGHVEVNGEMISVGGSQEKALLQQAQTKQLAHTPSPRPPEEVAESGDEL